VYLSGMLGEVSSPIQVYSPTSPEYFPELVTSSERSPEVYLPRMLREVPSPIQVYSPTSPEYFPELQTSSSSSQELPKSPQYRQRTLSPPYTEKSSMCNKTQIWCAPNTQTSATISMKYLPESQVCYPCLSK
jgi:hypothetical protein